MRRKPYRIEVNAMTLREQMEQEEYAVLSPLAQKAAEKERAEAAGKPYVNTLVGVESSID